MINEDCTRSLKEDLYSHGHTYLNKFFKTYSPHSDLNQVYKYKIK